MTLFHQLKKCLKPEIQDKLTMNNFFLTLHILSMCLVVGTLFLQSLIVVFRLRLKKQEEVNGVKNIQKRIHKLIYYPILGVTIISGIVLANKLDIFSQDKANWILLKLGLLIILIIFGMLNGKQIQKDVLPKKYAMMVHIPIFLIGAGMIYLASIKPF